MAVRFTHPTYLAGGIVPVSQKPSSRKKWLRLGLKLLIAAAVVWWVHGAITQGWAELKQQDVEWD